MPNILTLSPAPELIFGLVAPIGVNLEVVTDVLTKSLREVDYTAKTVRLTEEMKQVGLNMPLGSTTLVESYLERIAYANKICRLLGSNAMAAIAIGSIRTLRVGLNEARIDPSISSSLSDKDKKEIPVENTAYIIRQLKRPEEVELLRSVYGKQFILISVYATDGDRRRKLEDDHRRSHGALIDEDKLHNNVNSLLIQDAQEYQDVNGQNVRNAFPLGDVFIDSSSRSRCESMTKRFVNLLFGDNEITPTRDEYGMYLAKSAALRSADLSRQVGAAIFSSSGEVASLGCNEVPKFGGGSYWEGDENDHRDIRDGFDPNELRKNEVLIDFISRLSKGGHLADTITRLGSPKDVTEYLLSLTGPDAPNKSKMMDIIEFGRIIHAEMSAITDAARKGISVSGSTLHCTTFPCHICAKHIVSSGIKRVVYIEPYPKSYASDLHRDSIRVDGDVSVDKVDFQQFIGISPARYRDLFEKSRRKNQSGLAEKWYRGVRRPMIETYFPVYFVGETHVINELGRARDEVRAIVPEDFLDVAGDRDHQNAARTAPL